MDINTSFAEEEVKKEIEVQKEEISKLSILDILIYILWGSTFFLSIFLLYKGFVDMQAKINSLEHLVKDHLFTVEYFDKTPAINSLSDKVDNIDTAIEDLQQAQKDINAAIGDLHLQQAQKDINTVVGDLKETIRDTQLAQQHTNKSLEGLLVGHYELVNIVEGHKEWLEFNTKSVESVQGKLSNLNKSVVNVANSLQEVQQKIDDIITYDSNNSNNSNDNQ